MEYRYQERGTTIEADLSFGFRSGGGPFHSKLYRTPYYSLVVVDVPRIPFSNRFARELESTLVALLAIKPWYLIIVARAPDGRLFTSYEEPFEIDAIDDAWLATLRERVENSTIIDYGMRQPKETRRTILSNPGERPVASVFPK